MPHAVDLFDGLMEDTGSTKQLARSNNHEVWPDDHLMLVCTATGDGTEV